MTAGPARRALPASSVARRARADAGAKLESRSSRVFRSIWSGCVLMMYVGRLYSMHDAVHVSNLRPNKKILSVTAQGATEHCCVDAGRTSARHPCAQLSQVVSCPQGSDIQRCRQARSLAPKCARTPIQCGQEEPRCTATAPLRSVTGALNVHLMALSSHSSAESSCRLAR